MRFSMLIGVLILISIFSYADGEQKINKEKAEEIFANLKKHEGVWRGRSTKGWESRTRVQVIARGSVVMSSSEFIDSPGEEMVTMFFMDGDRLRLTHFYEAGNQPTLEATSAMENGGFVFEFSGGTNLPDRNTGHMDKAVFQFIDDNHYTSQWTWYANGIEKWMENIEYERLE